MRVPVSPHLCQCLLVFLRVALLVGVTWYLIVVLPSVFFVGLFVCFLTLTYTKQGGDQSQSPLGADHGWELPFGMPVAGAPRRSSFELLRKVLGWL